MKMFFVVLLSLVLSVSVVGCGSFDASFIADLFIPPSDAVAPGYPENGSDGDGIEVGDIVPTVSESDSE